MNIWDEFICLWRVFTKTRQRIEVWDTSAVSIWLDMLQNKVETVDGIKIIITEGVVHELSVGRHKVERARNAYKYIKSTTSDKLLKVATDDKTRTWTIDEQIIYTANVYYKKGHNVLFVTCDQDQAYKAELKGLQVLLLEANRELSKEATIKTPPRVVFSVGKEPNAKFGDEMRLEYKKRSRRIFVHVFTGLEIYDNRGKRRIGKDGWIEIEPTNKIIYFGSVYSIQSIDDTCVNLKKI